MTEVAYRKVGDTSPTLDIICKDSDGNVVQVIGATVQFHLRLCGSASLVIDAAGSVVDGATGHIRYTPQVGDFDTAGFYEAEYEVTYSDGSIETFPNDGNLQLILTSELG